MKFTIKGFVYFLVIIVASIVFAGCSQEEANGNQSDNKVEGEQQEVQGDSQEGDQEEVAWPEDGKEFTYIVGYDPGGSVDGTARITEPYLEEELGISVTIQNTPGSGNLIGLNETFSRPSDGYTWTYGSTVDGPWPHYYLSPSGTPWELEDWRSLGIYGQFANMGLFTTHDAPWEDFADFILDARARPGEITVASLGPGRFDDIWMIELQEFFDVEFNWVFYDSSGTIQTDVLTGDIDVGLIQTQREDFVEHPDFKVLTAIGADLPEDYPFEFPTLRDFEDKLDYNVDELKALTIETANTFMVKADTPEPVFEKLAAVAENIFTNPDWQEEMLAFTWPTYVPPEEADEFYKNVADVIGEYKELHQQYVE